MIGKAQLWLTTLTMVVFHSRVPVSRDSVTLVCRHNTRTMKSNVLAIVQFVLIAHFIVISNSQLETDGAFGNFPETNEPEGTSRAPSHRSVSHCHLFSPDSLRQNTFPMEPLRFSWPVWFHKEFTVILYVTASFTVSRQPHSVRCLTLTMCAWLRPTYSIPDAGRVEVPVLLPDRWDSLRASSLTKPTGNSGEQKEMEQEKSCVEYLAIHGAKGPQMAQKRELLLVKF